MADEAEEPPVDDRPRTPPRAPPPPLRTHEIAVGDRNAIFLVNGRVSGCGMASFGQLGLGRDDYGARRKATPIDVPGSGNIVQVASGFCYTVFLDDFGRVYACGRNDFGQLCLGDTDDRHTPARVESLDRVVRIAVGSWHNAFVTDDGRVYMCGENFAGQLGLGDYRNRFEPTLVAALAAVKIREVAIGFVHTVFLDSEGNVYVCGNSTYNQSGVQDESIPVRVVLPERVAAVSTKYFHTVLLGETGSVYAFGDNQEGQLGLGDQNMRTTPVLVSVPPAAAVSAGGRHTLILTRSGEAYSWGCRDSGLARDASAQACLRPGLIAVPGDESVVRVVAGTDTSFLVTAAGDVYTCGRNDFGQLGLGDFENRFMLTKVVC